MRHIKLTKFDTANGVGIREVLWVAGCEHHCIGCHNQSTWDKDQGEECTVETVQTIIDDLAAPYRHGITFSGGDPLAPYNQEAIFDLAAIIRKVYGQEKTIWCYTGYLWEDVKKYPQIGLFDVLVDGEFILSQRNISLPYCGSDNQRVIDVQKSLQQNTIVLWDNSSLK